MYGYGPHSGLCQAHLPWCGPCGASERGRRSHHPAPREGNPDRGPSSRPSTPPSKLSWASTLRSATQQSLQRNRQRPVRRGRRCLAATRPPPQVSTNSVRRRAQRRRQGSSDRGWEPAYPLTHNGMDFSRNIVKKEDRDAGLGATELIPACWPLCRLVLLHQRAKRVST